MRLLAGFGSGGDCSPQAQQGLSIANMKTRSIIRIEDPSVKARQILKTQGPNEREDGLYTAGLSVGAGLLPFFRGMCSLRVQVAGLLSVMSFESNLHRLSPETPPNSEQIGSFGHLEGSNIGLDSTIKS